MRELNPLTLPLEGRQLIEASAGTGKTYTITTLVLRLLLERGLDLEQILVVTYTRAATAELRSRVRQRIAALHHALGASEPPEDSVLAALRARSLQQGTLDADRRRVQRALYQSDEAAIFTIHGFCQRVLADFAFETDTPFALELRAHAEGLVAEVVRDYWTHTTQRIDADVYAKLRAKGPDAIRDLVLSTLHGPPPRRVPEDVDEPRPDTTAWSSAMAALRERWPSEVDGMAEVLQAAKIRLTGRSLARSLEALEHALSTPRPGLSDDAWEALCKLTVDADAKAAKKELSLTHPLLTTLRELHAAEQAQRQWCDAQVRLRLWDAVGYARRELADRTAARGEATFDQLLSRAHQALTGPRRAALRRALQRRYRAALIDEFQDTDPLQYEVFTGAFDGLPLLLIGDPKQAIYSFRGADVFAYLQARESVGDSVHTLPTNYRSDPGVIGGLNHVYGHCEQPFALEDIRYVPVAAKPGAVDQLADGGAAVELLWVEPESGSKADQQAEICERVASDIVRTLQSGARLGGRPLVAGDIAVLCRKNKQAHAVQQALANRGVPSLLQGDSSVFDTPDALELERLLAALVDPGDARALRSALAGVYLGLTASEIDALSEDDAWERHRERVLNASRTWQDHGFIRGLRQCLREYAVDERLMARTDGARRWTNLQHLIELLQEAALQDRLGPDGLLRWLRTMRNDVAVRAELLGESAQIRLESLEDAVRLTTVHRSKGLEYPLVYCPFAWEALSRGATFPLVHPEREPSSTLLDLGSSQLGEHKKRERLEARSDDLRVLYVALTRAKHGLRVVCGPLSGAGDSALNHLLGVTQAKPEASEMQQQLLALAHDSGGQVALRELAPPSDRTLERPTPREVHAQPRVRTRRAFDAEQISSFTALSHASSEANDLDDGGVDHDALQSAADEALAAPVAESKGAEAPLVALHGFPRGPSAGTAVHELLEQVDFAAGPDAWAEAAHTLLPTRGIPAEQAPTLAAAMHAVMHTPLDDAGLRLCDVAAADRVPELEFLFRVDPERRTTSRHFAQLLRAQGAPRALPGYADRVAQLDFASLGGFLRGFIDLVFTHAGRFYVVDYKSNDLGPRPQDYAPGRLAASMGEHHYYLQYLLYSIAVHRHLAQRLSDYDYDRHFGGVFYLFLRGMAPERGPATGVFFDRPARALIEALDDALLRAGEAPP